MAIQPGQVRYGLWGLGEGDAEAEGLDLPDVVADPPTLYRPVAERLAAIGRQRFSGRLFHLVDEQIVRAQSYEEYRGNQRAFLSFLARRSSDAFRRAYMDVDPDLPGRLVEFTSFVNAVLEPDVLARLHQAGLLTELLRLQAVERMTHLAVSTPDDGWAGGRPWKVLLTAEDREAL